MKEQTNTICELYIKRNKTVAINALQKSSKRTGVYVNCPPACDNHSQPGRFSEIGEFL